MSSTADVQHAAQLLRSGGVVAFPTETVYGLGADALSESAVARVYELKGRPAANPLIVHVTGPEMARTVAAQWPDAAEALAREFWPGPLSIVLPKKDILPTTVTGGGPNVAVRCPNHPLALALLFEFGRPIVGPSANPSGRVSPTTADHVRSAFSSEDVFVLDGGACPMGIESTVVSLAAHEPRVLRPGVIGPHDIARIIGRHVQFGPPAASARDASAPLHSPGLLAAHYAPMAPAVLFRDGELPRLLASREVGRGGLVAVLSHENDSPPPPHRLFSLPANAHGYAAALYAALRDADDLRPALIAIRRPPEPDPIDPDADTWAAIADRLSRAATPFGA